MVRRRIGANWRTGLRFRRFYANPSSPKFHNLIKSTEIQNGSGTVRARTEFYYDNGDDTPDKGNLTETRVWDSYKGGTARAYSNPLTSTNSISTFNTFDTYGNILTTTDANNVVTTITYGCIDGNEIVSKVVEMGR